MKLSVIIPVYNTANFVCECINSVLNQDGLTLGQDYEIICVNDGSTDHSLEVLHQMAGQLHATGDFGGGIAL